MMKNNHYLRNKIYLRILEWVGKKLFGNIAVCFKGNTSEIVGISFTNSTKYMSALMEIDYETKRWNLMFDTVKRHREKDKKREQEQHND